MRKFLSGLFILSGVLLILAAVGLWGYNAIEARNAGERSAVALAQIKSQSAQSPTQPSQEMLQLEETTAPAQAPTLPEEMPTALVDGRAYVGTLTIPALELELPILADWSYELLELAPCRYSGDIYTGDLVLCGHSFRTHFGGISQLSPGDLVIFTTIDGQEYIFKAALTEVLEPTAITQMRESEYPLTLFTCTNDSQNRVTLRCEEVS